MSWKKTNLLHAPCVPLPLCWLQSLKQITTHHSHFSDASQKPQKWSSSSSTLSFKAAGISRIGYSTISAKELCNGASRSYVPICQISSNVQISSTMFKVTFKKNRFATSCNGTLQCHSFSKALPAGLGKEDTAWVNAFTSHRMVRIYAWNYTNIHERDRISIHLISTLSGTKLLDLLVLDKLNTRMQAQVLPKTVASLNMFPDLQRTSAISVLALWPVRCQA